MSDIIGKDSIATLVNGVCERNFRAKEARIQRSFENYQQLQQHAHDEKMQWNDHQFMHEMQEREHEFQLKQQKDIFENNKKEERRKEFLENSWPLSLSPEDYLIKLEEYKNSYGLLPLNVIIPNIIISGKSLSLTNIDSFFNDCYKYNSISPVLERSGDWKNDFLERTKGNALLQNLRMVFRLPTLVVLPEVVGDDLRINVSYWGMLDQEDPAIYQMFSLNLQELKLYIMRKKAKEEWHGWQEMKEECPTDTNAYIWHEEELFAQMKRLEKIEDITIQKFCDIKYGKKYLEKEISDVWEREETLHVSWLINLTACIISDIYFLTEYDVQPKFAKLLKQMPVFFVERQSYYTDLLEAIFLEVVRKERLFLNGKKTEIDVTYETRKPSEKDEYYQHLVNLSYSRPSKRLGHGFPALHAAYIADEFYKLHIENEAKKFIDLAVIDLEKIIGANDFLEYQRKAIDVLKVLNKDKQYENVSRVVKCFETKIKILEAEQQKAEQRKKGLAILGEDWTIKLANNIEMVLVWISPGSFDMGSDDEDSNDDEKPMHKVNITKGYWIGKYQLTQEQWKALGGEKEDENNNIGKFYPVDNVSWDEARSFCKLLTQQLKDKIGDYCFDLPTEAQWEFAARERGNSEHRYKFSGSNNLFEVGWCDCNSNKKTHEVGKKKANSLDIYDMSGNVWEWCRDYCEWDATKKNVKTKTYFKSEKGIDDPYNENGSQRVFRGGSLTCNEKHCRLTNRDCGDPTIRFDDLGFRVALVPVQG